MAGSGRQETDRDQEWPDWPLSRAAAAQLARYVSVTYAARWVPTDLRGTLPSEATIGQRHDRAERLYESLAARRIPYASVPWNPAAYDSAGRPAYQRIRTPLETIEGPATCLDLVLTFAGMAIEADLRPLIAIRYHPAPHALVMLELSGGANQLTDYASPPDRSGFRPRPGQPGVWDAAGSADRSLAKLAGLSGWLPVNVVGATQGDEFATASGRRVAADEDLPGAVWTLVDVRRVLASLDAKGAGAFSPSRGRSVPPIHGYLPAVPDFRDFSSRRPVLRELQDIIDAGKPTTLVIQAPPGYGKSMLAHRLAVGADNGCGWFLNATDTKELRRSLAQAERSEHELGGEQPRPGGEKADPGDDQAFAAAALDRLRATDQPWMVVVDNCDSPPTTPGLTDLLPRPHATGQVVIITTIDPAWLDYATDTAHRVQLTGLADGDLRAELGLPRGLTTAVSGRPLIGLALAALRDHGAVELPADSAQDGPELVWDLLRGPAQTGADAVGLARLLSWLPPEPIPEQSLAKIGLWDASPRNALERLRFVTRTAAAVPGLDASEGTGGSSGLLMHRLFAAAVREQTWRDQPGAAADAIARLLTTEHGRWIFITAADDTTLARLERGADPDLPGEAARAADQLIRHPGPGRPAPGLLWHGLGHIRERRGPVRDSGQPFRRAVDTLDPDQYPYQVAEAQIGLARVIYQEGRSTIAELDEAREMTRKARDLLASRRDLDSRQLREQGNALSWLIEQRLTGREPDLDRRLARYIAVYENLWSSFAARLRIARDLSDDTPIDRDAVPELRDGLGPERAFYNMAGTAIQLAKTRHQLAMRAAAAAGRPLSADDELLGRIAKDLGIAERVYQAVRELREQRYSGRPHPHLAACLNGLAIVGYYRAALLGEVGALASAASHGATALDQRLRIAGSLVGPGAAGVVNDPDVRKSADLLLKIMTATVLARYTDPAEGSAALIRTLREATSEWLSGPDRLPEERTQPESAVLAFEHEVHVELPAELLSDSDSSRTSALIQGALTRLGPMLRATPEIEVIRVRPAEPDEPGGVGSLDVGLASSAPVGKQLDTALRWVIANAVRTPDPEKSQPRPQREAAVRDISEPPSSPGFVEAPPSDVRPRYLSATYPDAAQPGRRFSLEASVVLSRGAGRSEALLYGLRVPPGGKRLKLSIYAPGLTVYGDHQQEVYVPADRNSAPVRFDLAGARTGVQRVRLRAWEGGTCVGEVWAEITIDDHARGGHHRTLESEMEAGGLSGEVTLEVTHHYGNGENRYGFRFRDPEMEFPEEFLPLRGDPAADVERLIGRLDLLAEDAEASSPDELYRALKQEGAQLWDDLIPVAVQEQFWECMHRITQLTILADNDAFPWELLYPTNDDVGFLATLDFPVTRRIEKWRRPRELYQHPARFVLPEGAPARAKDEVNVLRQLLDAQEPNVSTLRELQTLIDNGGFGIMHFACHGSFSRDDMGPQIHLDKAFLPRELALRRKTWQAPLVFLNACRSAGARHRCIGQDSFAEKFIHAGAGAFIGSLWEVRDGTAPSFAIEMYQMLKDGHTLGSAVTELRRRVQDGDPTWLAYAVYGHPQAKLF